MIRTSARSLVARNLHAHARYIYSADAIRVIVVSRTGSVMAGPILVVEDEPLVRLDMVDMLRSSGYDVIDVGSTDDANAVLQRRDDISLVCTDVLLPGQVDGLALTRWIKANRLQVSVILVTAELPATVPPPVGDALIPKPVAVDRLFQTVGELLKSRA